MIDLFNKTSVEISKLITNSYSTSFSIGVRLLHKSIRESIFSIYGFVRVADEIVDSFNGYNKEKLLLEFRKQTFDAINEGISTNPVLNSFQAVVKKYDIDLELIRTFFNSMEMDLTKRMYNYEEFKNYVNGSAEVVGLMCLKVFVNGDLQRYEKLKPYAITLGAAFQKVNFLRDINHDYKNLGRVYFPDLNFENLNSKLKKQIESEIDNDFKFAYEGIKLLPNSAKLGVLVAFTYYKQLLKKIKEMDFDELLHRRSRISNFVKFFILLKTIIKHKLNIIK